MEMSELAAKPHAMEKAVILARGLGTRMRRAEQSVTGLSAEQAKVAASGVKAMMPMGRPFLDHAMSALADAGFQKLCLVIGPEHESIREYYKSVPRKRVTIEFATQEKPLGTADALLAAKEFAADDLFLMVNSDNYYPVEVLKKLSALEGSGLAAFDRDALIRLSNIEAERIRQYAILKIQDDHLVEITEKPTEVPTGADVYVSMNCWVFDASIFEACTKVNKSIRGEYELADAVKIAIHEMGVVFRVIHVAAGVLDLSSPNDVASVDAILRGSEVDL
jgi:glucose-1-phosphate thymidylyltransferase